MAGPLRFAEKNRASLRTLSRSLVRHQIPPLAHCDPWTGQQMRASWATNNRFEHEGPGTFPHIDVKKHRRSPDGGWRAHPDRTGE